MPCPSLFGLRQDAVELPRVAKALSEVNRAVERASEGLSEASAGGGVLLMEKRVAQAISQVRKARGGCSTTVLSSKTVFQYFVCS